MPRMEYSTNIEAWGMHFQMQAIALPEYVQRGKILGCHGAKAPQAQSKLKQHRQRVLQLKMGAAPILAQSSGTQPHMNIKSMGIFAASNKVHGASLHGHVPGWS